MRGKLLRVVVGTVLTLAFGATPALAAPDLRVTAIKLQTNLGAPPHALLERDGGSSVRLLVTVRNLGATPAPGSSAGVVVDLGPGRTSSVTTPIQSLDPGETDKAVATGFEGLRPGFARAIACADNASAIAESREGNNCLTRFDTSPQLALLPRFWKVTRFSATYHPPDQGSHVTRSLKTMRFQYLATTNDDSGYFYEPHGGLRADTTGSYGGICSIAGSSGIRSESPWPLPSELFVAGELNGYFASIDDPASDPFNTTITCPGSSYTLPEHPQELVTWVGPETVPPMQPGDTRLVGAGVFGTAPSDVEYAWRFDADIPALP